MWWLERRAMLSGTVRLALLAVLAAFLGGCFQPLYGSRTLDGSASIGEALSQVDIAQIPAANGTPEARVAVELRNALMFNVAGATPAAPTHRLAIRITSQRTSVIVDINTARPDVENYGLVADYTLMDLRSGKVVVTGQASTRVSYDIPGQEQRFARQRALRESETRAANVIADAIKARLASYFVAGT
jgi:LPS-assembly lipoprotein